MGLAVDILQRCLQSLNQTPFTRFEASLSYVLSGFLGAAFVALHVEQMRRSIYVEPVVLNPPPAKYVRLNSLIDAHSNDRPRGPGACILWIRRWVRSWVA
jgi:hypothetical protein